MRQSKVNCFPAVVLALLAASCTRRIVPPPVAWLKTFGNGSQSYFSCIRETGDGGFILAGAILSEKGNRYDFPLSPPPSV